MNQHQNNHLPPDLMHQPNTKAKENARYNHYLHLSQAVEKMGDLEQRLKEIRKCQNKLGSHCKILFKKIYKPTNNNLKKLSKHQNQGTEPDCRQSQGVATGLARDSDEEIDKQNWEALSAIWQRCNGSCSKSELVYYPSRIKEKVDSNVIPDSSDMCDNDIQTDKNAEECDYKRAALANLIANLTLDTEENKKILKQLKKADASLTKELKECKSNLEEFAPDKEKTLTLEKERVNHRTNVSRPPLKSIQMKDKVVPNNSQVKSKKTEIVQLILFIVDSGCTKHTTGNLKLLCNFVECLNHNLFSVGQFCDADLEKLLHQLQYLSWLKPHQLKHGYGIEGFLILTFNYINLLSKKDIVIGLPKLKYVKDQLCSSCELSKEKKSKFKTKVVPSSKGWLNLLHMDLYGLMRVESINGKKYILVIVDDYSRYTWTLFLRFKDETPEVLKDFLKMIQHNLQAQVITVRTNRGTEFLNKKLTTYFKEEGI
ncbi:retrovirus-related pol polyprotein from transposon TNT 1-94 [Tanacetum coccineum]